MSKQNKAIYLYCLARADMLKAVTGGGIDQQNALMIAPFKKVVAVYSAVDLTDFTGPQAEAKLQDIGWVGPRALAHEKVVAEVSNSSPVLPARFGTIFSSLNTIEQLLKAKHDAIEASLDKVSNRQEWSLKGYLNKQLAVREQVAKDVAAKREELDKLTQGARYFQEKKLEAAARKTFASALSERTVGILEELEPFIVEKEERKLLSREATGKESDMVLNWSLLVDCEKISQLAVVIDKLNREAVSSGLLLEFSGPWPPYSFCPTFSLAAD